MAWKVLREYRKEIGVFIVARWGEGVKVSFHGQGFVWFETPTGTKEGSFWDFLSAFPDVRQKGMKERYGSKVVSNQTSKNIESDSLLGLLKILFPWRVRPVPQVSFHITVNSTYSTCQSLFSIYCLLY